LLQIRRDLYSGPKEFLLVIQIARFRSRTTPCPSPRDKDGLVEVHEKFADVIAIQVGNATLIVGGEVVEPASIEAGEIRGKSIQGGIRRTGSRGDVIHIGAGTPHQFLMAPGEQITYILVKIAAPF
jgi:hypothetical protein